MMTSGQAVFPPVEGPRLGQGPGQPRAQHDASRALRRQRQGGGNLAPRAAEAHEQAAGASGCVVVPARSKSIGGRPLAAIEA